MQVIPERIKVELKRQNTSGAEELGAAWPRIQITNTWQTVEVPLGDFRPADYRPPLSSWADMQELTLVLTRPFTGPPGSEGWIFLDNIRFCRRVAGAP
jgi:hypothetical protein